MRWFGLKRILENIHMEGLESLINSEGEILVMADIEFYNTLGRKKQKFVPIEDGKVRLYTCGPTVYARAHIGNLKMYIFEDVLRRVLEHNGLKVTHVMNVTDVGHLTSDADEGGDKMENGAKREGKNIWEIARRYESEFFKDCAALNIEKPTIICRATDHIEEQIKLIEKLDKMGFVYNTSDGVYFDSSKFKNYGQLGLLNISGLEAGKRVEVKEKRHPTDFALWKFSKKEDKRQMEWSSPWGTGFPGWHIECSAMAMKYLGDRVDVHTGGVDHIPIHHTNEIAQSETVLGHKWVNYWLHGEFLITDKEKMSKSSGDFLTLDLVREKGFTPLEYRFFCIGTHYRSPLTFSWDRLDGARNSLKSLAKEVIKLRSQVKTDFENGSKMYESEFLSKVNDDLNLPGAMAVVWAMIKSDLPASQKYSSLLKFDKVLGLGLGDLRETKIKVPSEIMDLVERRSEARKAKDWKLADQLRNEIASKGFRVDDTETGFEVSKQE